MQACNRIVLCSNRSAWKLPALIARPEGQSPGYIRRMGAPSHGALQQDKPSHIASATSRAIGPVSFLIVDYDDTCSEGDTVHNLLMCAVNHMEEGSAERKTLADSLSANYYKEYTEFMGRYLPTKNDDKLQSSFDPEGLVTFLDKLSDFDIAMNSIVIDSGILAGMSVDQIKAAAAAVSLKSGCSETLTRLQQMGLPMCVMSLNWSSTYIAAALAPDSQIPHVSAASLDAISTAVGASDNEETWMPYRTLVPAMASEEGPGGALSLMISNELDLGEDGRTSGAMQRVVQSGRCKGLAFDALMKLRATVASKIGGSPGGALPSPSAGVAYVGDSASDLLPLLKADYGIVLGKSGGLRKVARQYGITFAPLCSAPRTRDPAHVKVGLSGILYEASGWEEINAFLFRKNGHPPPRALTIAGSDSGGGAGIQADLKTFLTQGVFGTSAVAALTAQNTHGVQAVHVSPLEFFEQQIDAVLGDIGSDVVKTGMLPSPSHIQLVARKVRQYNLSRLVVDPVMVSTSGHSLVSDDGTTRTVPETLLEVLLPLAELATPNIPEASMLLGGREITSVADMEEAAIAIHKAALGLRCVLVKGGHLPLQEVGQAGSSTHVVDVFYDGTSLHRLTAQRIHTPNSHGTGCTLASAIAAALARGLPTLEAVHSARQYLSAALSASVELKIGGGVQPPFNHGFMLSDWGAGPSAASSVPRQAVRSAMRAYVVTDAKCNAKNGRTLVEAVRLAVAGGATIVQIREKDVEGGELLAMAKEVLEVCRAAGVPLIINDRVDVALAAGPDVGVHVGQGDLPASAVRQLLGPHRILGVSVKTVEQAMRAVRGGADYIGVGAVFPTSTKDTNVIGCEGLATICSTVDIPVVAIGGISASNTAQTIQAGCDGVAVVSAVFGVANVTAATREIRDAADQALGL